MDINIIEINPEDIHKFPGLKETLENLSPVGDMDNSYLEKTIFEMNNRDSHLFSAIDKENIVGVTSVYIEQKIIHNGGKVGHIEDVAINKSYEGKGIGRMLVNHATDYAKNRGCYKVVLNCHQELEEFYKKLGFQTTEIFMRKDIT